MKKIFTVISDHDNMRVDRWLRKNSYNYPQSLLEKLLRSGKIKVNEKKVKSSFKVKTNFKIQVFNLNFNKTLDKNKFKPDNKTIEKYENGIIFDCDEYIVINKLPGIPVQGGTKSRRNLIDIFKKSRYFKYTQPYTVHRLDKDTSGIFLIAKNRKSAQFFTSLFRLRKIYKTYLAICHGEISKHKGILENNLEKFEKNKKILEKAITSFKVIDRNNNFSLLEMKPITGRKHQLRKQCSLIGHPICGDNKYNKIKISQKNLMLHSYSIKFKINNNKLNYIAPLPNHFKNFLDKKKLYI